LSGEAGELQIGIGFGLWFADAAAGALISLDIVRDGVRNVKAAAAELMDARPTTYDLSDVHPLVGEAERVLRELDWVRDARVRLREEGHVFAGEAHVLPVSGEDLNKRLEDAADRLLALDWRLHDVIVASATADGFRRLEPFG
jgi:divalent metal cation (Fe/Co/Zn/Cd) transporter